MAETHRRSVAKAISWRVTGTIDTFLIIWLITGELVLASGIAGTEVMTKVFLFYLHERAWTRVRWGRKPALQATPSGRPAGMAGRILTFPRTCEPVSLPKP